MNPASATRYPLLRRIAVGGMAEIFLAKVTGIEGFEKLVVLKRILPKFSSDERWVRMFLQEAKLAATLHHPHIAQVYDFGKMGDSYFYTMEFVQGPDVRRIFSASQAARKPIPVEHALSICIGTAAGLDYAHEKRTSEGRPLEIVHRDVSPANVLVDYAGCVKLVDFGIAKATLERHRTEPGTVKGKLCYMSPEQARGLPVDRRSDVFALGILLYELTTGQLLFSAPTDFEVLNLLLNERMPLPSEIVEGYPPELESIVMHALQREPEERFPTGRAVHLALEAFARERRMAVSPISLAQYLEELFGKNLDVWRNVGIDDAPPLEHVTSTLAGLDPDTGTSQYQVEYISPRGDGTELHLASDLALLPGTASERQGRTTEVETPIAPPPRKPLPWRRLAVAGVGVMAAAALLYKGFTTTSPRATIPVTAPTPATGAPILPLTEPIPEPEESAARREVVPVTKEIPARRGTQKIKTAKITTPKITNPSSDVPEAELTNVTASAAPRKMRREEPKPRPTRARALSEPNLDHGDPVDPFEK